MPSTIILSPRPPPPKPGDNQLASAGSSVSSDIWGSPTYETTKVQNSYGRYLFGPEIGRGGVGVVHEGWDIHLEREIDIKVLLEEHRNKPDIVRRFLEEARITSRLQHPGIIAIHDLGFLPDNRPFFAMRLIRGQTLNYFLGCRAKPSIDLPRFIGIFVQVCQAVAYAHSQGVIHRDLKPSNIMVGAYGVLKVTDWGFAKELYKPELTEVIKATSAAAHLRKTYGLRNGVGVVEDTNGTQAGMVFGTPAYLSSEQAMGNIDQIDKRTDVFGLGSILCEILTGNPPYTGENAREVYNKAASADIADAFARLDTCSAANDLLALTKACLSPKQEQRPADAHEVLKTIDAYIQSDQRRAERDLVRFFDLSIDLFCIASTDGYFLRVNENFPRLLGFTAQELTSRPFVEFVHPDDRDRTLVACSRLDVGLHCIQFVNRYRHVDGHYLWFEWNAYAVPEERTIYALARDVTERLQTAG